VSKEGAAIGGPFLIARIRCVLSHLRRTPAFSFAVKKPADGGAASA